MGTVDWNASIRGLKFSHVGNVSGKCSVAKSTQYGARVHGTICENGISLITSTREIIWANGAKSCKKFTSPIPGEYLHNHTFNRNGTSTTVMRIRHTGEWNVVLGFSSGSCNANGISEKKISIFDIFHLVIVLEDYWNECMKRTRFLQKCSVFMLSIIWKTSVFIW